MVKIIQSSAEFAKEIKGPGLVVVDYYADWCGPCREMAPIFDDLSRKYPMVKFLKVNADTCSVAQERGIRSLPTFQFFLKGEMIDELKGKDQFGLVDRIQRYKVDAVESFAGSGFSLGGPSAAPPADLRAARALAFQSIGSSSSSAAPPPPSKPVEEVPVKAASVPESNEDESDEALLAMAMAMVPADETQMQVSDGNDGWDEEMVPVPVDEELLRQLVEMDVSDVRARKAIVHGLNLEGAFAWLEEHQNDEDIDQPYMVKKSDTLPKRVLTEEEKQVKIEEMRLKIKRRKEEKERVEKEAEIRREKERRERGKTIGEMQEERDRIIRQREAEKAKREKMEAAVEKARIKAEIERDRELRRQNKGKLPSVLGTEGYNPSAINYEDKAQTAHVTGSSAAATTASAAPSAAATIKAKTASQPNERQQVFESLSADEKIASAIQTILKYRTANAGGDALKLLRTFVKNIAENPNEPKYRSVNMESAAYKSKLLPIVGPSVVFKALGFIKTEDSKWKLDGDVDVSLFSSSAEKLLQAEEQYRAMNP